MKISFVSKSSFVRLLAACALTCGALFGSADLNDRALWSGVGCFKKAPAEAGVLADSKDPLPKKGEKIDGKKAGNKGQLTSAEFVIDKPYLNFEIAGSYSPFRTALNLWVDGAVVRTATGDGSDVLKKASFDVSEFLGKKAKIVIVDHSSEAESFMRAARSEMAQAVSLEKYFNLWIKIGALELADAAWAPACGDVDEARLGVEKMAASFIEKMYVVAQADPARPVYHFRPPAGRLNDANGPFYADGYYHIFYQYNPFLLSYMAWGHARSRDLVHWEHLPVALWPDWAHGEYHCYSGSTRFKDGTATIVYTFVPAMVFPRNQWIARSTGDFLKWERPPCNPVIRFTEGEIEGMNPSVRDPFVFEAGGRTFAVLCGDEIYLYEALADDLSQWAYRNTIWKKGEGERGAECPNMFRIGDKFVLMFSPFGSVRYKIGSFDADNYAFTPEKEGLVNHSSGFYATTGCKDDKGRWILYAHLKGVSGASAGRGWRDTLLLPRVLDLDAEGNLNVKPVPEVELLRGNLIAQADNVEIGGDTRIEGLKGDVLEFDAKIRFTDATKRIVVRVRAPAQGAAGGCEIVYDAQAQTLFIEGTRAEPAPLKIKDGVLELRVFLDKAILEVFANNGKLAEARSLSKCRLGDLDIVFSAEGGAVLESLRAWSLTPTAEGKAEEIFPNAF